VFQTLADDADIVIAYINHDDQAVDQDIEAGRQRITAARFMEAGRMVKEVALGF